MKRISSESWKGWKSWAYSDGISVIVLIAFSVRSHPNGKIWMWLILWIFFKFFIVQKFKKMLSDLDYECKILGPTGFMRKSKNLVVPPNNLVCIQIKHCSTISKSTSVLYTSRLLPDWTNLQYKRKMVAFWPCIIITAATVAEVGFVIMCVWTRWCVKKWG